MALAVDDMRPEDLDYFSDFLAEFQKETDRGAALVGASLIDARLERVLCSHLTDQKLASELVIGGSAPIGRLSTRTKLAHCLGLITAMEYREIERVRKVRNEFAHGDHTLSFATQKVRDLCANMEANTPGGERCGGDPRRLFVNSVMGLSLSLWYRPEHAKEHRAMPREWSYQLSPER